MSEVSERLTESEKVYRWRLQRALAVGLPFVLAERFAATPHADLHRLESLIAGGCRPITAARILL